ncbi:hypothetical protein SI68_21480 [Salmonella enterica]|nr:hypothetical protein [Salmonella enterica]EBP2882708.1 hypothetical protein [Salmonella enterica]
MKKIVLSNVFLALLGSSVMANAADLTTNVNVTSVVQEPTGIHAQYAELTNIAPDSVNEKFGQITVTGYASSTTDKDVVLSDPSNTLSNLTFKSANHDWFNAKAVNTAGEEFVVNNSFSNATAQFDGIINLQTNGTKQNIKPGKYTDTITLKFLNQ